MVGVLKDFIGLILGSEIEGAETGFQGACFDELGIQISDATRCFMFDSEVGVNRIAELYPPRFWGNRR